MARVFIPPLLQEVTGVAEVEVPGNTLGQVIEALEEAYPGVAGRICVGDELVFGLTVAVDGAVSTRGLLTPIGPHSEVHFLPAIGGGSDARPT